jgi:hypothetical protein
MFPEGESGNVVYEELVEAMAIRLSDRRKTAEIYVLTLESVLGSLTPEACVYYWCVVALNFSNPNTKRDIMSADSALDNALSYAQNISSLRYKVLMTKGDCHFLDGKIEQALSCFKKANLIAHRSPYISSDALATRFQAVREIQHEVDPRFVQQY